jgi:hypothetical protein
VVEWKVVGEFRGDWLLGINLGEYVERCVCIV